MNPPESKSTPEPTEKVERKAPVAPHENPKTAPESADQIESKAAIEPEEKIEAQATPNPPARYRPKLSQHQKKRSRLDQAAEEPTTESATPSPAITLPPPGPPKTPAGEIPGIRRNRLKRSGQMHEDLTKPLPEADPGERESRY